MKSSQVFSQRIDCLTLDELYLELKQRIQERKKTLVFAMNLHILVELSKNPKLKKKHSRANFIFADGVPLVWFSRFTKIKLPERVSGTDLCERILADQSIQVFLLGSTETVLKKIKEKFPLTVKESYSPAFQNKWTEEENSKIINLINKSKAKILIVAVGPTKQEEWLLEHFEKTNAVMALGMGSALDILSGEKRRAPVIMRDYGLEWLWRICLEPKRLFTRYAIDCREFLLLLLTRK